jgi:hypothetical protein
MVRANSAKKGQGVYTQTRQAVKPMACAPAILFWHLQFSPFGFAQDML